METSNSNHIASYAAGPGSIPGRVNFLVQVFPEVFLNIKTNVRQCGPHSSPGIIWLSSEIMFIHLCTATVLL